jgi:hypothetical protein
MERVTNPETSQQFQVRTKGKPGSQMFQLDGVLERYEEQWKKEKLKRSYYSDAHQWSAEELSKFDEAFAKYGHGPASNRLIAQYIGSRSLTLVLTRFADIHPNHVVHQKRLRKKKEPLPPPETPPSDSKQEKFESE